MTIQSIGRSPAAGTHRRELTDGWELACTPPDTGGPGEIDAGGGWLPAPVPGTVGGALAGAADPDAFDWWYRLRFEAPPPAPGEEITLVLEGLATIAEVHLNGRLVLESASMFAAHRVEVGDLLRASNLLLICFRALAPRLRERRRPRARWRTRLVADGNLRFHRTMLLGRAPGFAPGPAVVGPWRPVALERRRGPVLERVRLRARVTGRHGVLDCRARLRVPAGAHVPARIPVTVSGPGGDVTGQLTVGAGDEGAHLASGAVGVPDVARWWPHTHGRPVLYDVVIGEPACPLHVSRTGFRELTVPEDLLSRGPALQINGREVFARGAVWAPLDLRAPHSRPDELRRVLEHLVRGGMNMLRVAGTGAYESDAFYDLCDELGILVWQDFMFANLDYPDQDPEFMAAVAAEARELMARVGHRPSLAVVCGGSEVAQQVAMLGLDPALADGPLYRELLPAAVADAGVDAPYIPSAPWGGDLPFEPGRGVANYYGVGAYLRPLEDARRAEVRFAAECLAFANVPDADALDALRAPGGLSVNHPAWKAGVPRDAGAGWDFDDVRDHYLRLLYGADPVPLRSVDQDRYLELSRAVSGEVMAEVLGEWRRAASPCAGALVLWLKDLRPGAGWGILDHRGEPKVAYHHLRRALAPVAVWTTDEGLGGIAVHVANDGPEPLTARLRVALYQDGERLVEEAAVPVEIGPGEQATHSVEGLLGRFVDAALAYRFGPPGHDVVAVSLESAGGAEAEPLSQAFRFPAGRPLRRASAAELGLTAALQLAGEPPRLLVASRRLAHGVRVSVPGYTAADDAFTIEPGHERRIPLTLTDAAAAGSSGRLTALNLAGSIRVPVTEGAPA